LNPFIGPMTMAEYKKGSQAMVKGPIYES
jgi:hypothetical protein